MSQTKKLGLLGERLAERFLIAKGYNLVCRNWRCRWGEIDLIVEKGKETVFVEVKLRAGSQYGGPEDALNFFKQRRFLSAMRTYLSQQPRIGDYRADVILINFDSQRKIAKLRHLQNVELE